MSYYSDEVAHGLEDYYAGRGEAEGVWLGRGATAEGLDGVVGGEALARLFDARHPGSGAPLGAPYGVGAERDRVTGWDLTFSAPKSVSVLWAVGGGRVGLEVRDAHDAAVAAAVAFLDEHAAFSRMGKAGIRQVDTEGLVAAGFVHRSSRAGDPQLHTHVLVSNRVRCVEDGGWRALDSRALHRQLKTAGMVYQAALRAELSARLGVGWTVVDRHGQAEIAGVPAGLRRLFSQRRTAVEARAGKRIAESEAALGRSLTAEERRRVFEVAVLETRTAKSRALETDRGLHDRWRSEAEAAGFGPESWISDTVGRRQDRREPAVSEIVDAVVTDLSAEVSTWRRSDALRRVARRTPVELGTAAEVRRWVEATAERVVAEASVVALSVPEPPVPVGLLRRDGASVYEHHDATRYTTVDTLAVEQRVLDRAEHGGSAGRGVADTAAVEAALTRSGLGQDQAAAVRSLTGDGDAVICVVGPAGAGKSRTMGTAARAWHSTGIPVRGLALSAVAAGVLEAEAGIGSDTIAKLLFEHDRSGGPHGRWQLRRGEVVVVDEAGMVASRDLARLARLVEQAEGKLVLVGDYAQLGAVEAGGLFRLLADIRAVELTGVHRFTAAWERDASLRLRAHDVGVIGVYEEHGRIHGGDRLAVFDAAFTAWHEARAAGESVVVCASDHATVDELSRRIRWTLVAAGRVEPGGVDVAGQTVGVGDEILTTRNDRRLLTTAGSWVRNGDRWRVTARHVDGSLAVSHLGGYGRVVLPAGYVADHVSLAYALTVHKAQGVTVDRAVLIADDATTAEALYVGLTRGRHTNTALVITDALDNEHQAPDRSAAQLLASALGRVSADQAAHDVARSAQAAASSLAVLVPRLADLNAWIARNTPPDPTADLQAVVCRRRAVEQHARPGHLTRRRRHDRRLLDDLDQRQHALDAAARHRQEWLDANAGAFTKRDYLAQRIVDRTETLGRDALRTQPEHLIDLIGPVPRDRVGRTRWAQRAATVEAYRERWNVNPDTLHLPPRDGLQHREWRHTLDTVRLLNQLDTPQRPQRTRGLDRDVGLGIEL